MLTCTGKIACSRQQAHAQAEMHAQELHTDNHNKSAEAPERMFANMQSKHLSDPVEHELSHEHTDSSEVQRALLCLK